MRVFPCLMLPALLLLEEVLAKMQEVVRRLIVRLKIGQVAVGRVVVTGPAAEAARLAVVPMVWMMLV